MDEHLLKRIRHNIGTWEFEYLGDYRMPEEEAKTILELINEKIGGKEDEQ